MARRSTRVSSVFTKSTPSKRKNETSESDFEDDNASGSDFANTKKGKRVKRQSKQTKVDRASTEEEEDSDGESRPPKVTIIPLPKAREAGDTPYEDGRIHENTMLFLKDLKANNNREWLRFHDEDFRNAQKDFASFIEKLSELVIEKDYTIPELPSKDIIFRIYRDVRFSNDKTPYKPHFSAAWSRTGKKGPYAAYYLHVQPGGHSFIGGGLWHPPGPAVEKLRNDIDESPHRLKRALMTDALRRDFFKGAKDEKAVIAQFTETNAEGALKTKPKGYDADHRDIKLLRLKDFTIGRKLSDSDITAADGLQRIAGFIESMVPFITHLNSVVMPDRNAADSSDDEDDENEEDDE